MVGERVQEPSCRPAQGQLVAQGVAHKIMQPAGLAETNLGLRRVHVHVDLFRRHVDKQQHDRKGRGREDIAIGLADRMHQQAVAHQAAIDEAVDRVAVQFLQFRLGGESGNTQPAGRRSLVVRGPPPRRRFRKTGARQLDFGRQRQQLVQSVLAENLKNALRRLLDRGRDQQGMGGRVQLEVLVRVGQRVMSNQGGYVSQLRVFRLEEFSPRRGIKEQVAHRERGARGRARLFAQQQLAPGNFHPCARGFFPGAGDQLYPGNGRDRGQGFSAKAQGGNREQIVARAQLGGSVPFERQQRIIAHHAAAIIGNAYELASSALHADHDAGGAGVEGILQQLFDHRRRPVNYFAGRDLIGHLVGQYVDTAHSLFSPF